MDSGSELKLISLISQLVSLYRCGEESKAKPLIIQIVFVVKSMDMDSQPKPESKLMSLITQTVPLFNSMDICHLPKPLSDLISLISQRISLDSDQETETDLIFELLVNQTLELKQDPEFMSPIRQIVSAVIFMDSKELISLCPQVEVSFKHGKFQVIRKVSWSSSYATRNCLLGIWDKLLLREGVEASHFRCRDCNGEYHKEYEKAPLVIKHPLHHKHSLQLVWNLGGDNNILCYCCDEQLKEAIYCCLACEFTMNIVCVEKPPVLSIPPTKWHDHKLDLFPRKASLTCNVCTLDNPNSPFYICPPCDFVVHLKCINLPRVLRISRHHHRIRYTPSFEEGTWSCGVCRRKIDNDCGGYSCIMDGCLYAAHSRCATQRNVWDGIDLEGQPEEIEEEVVEPFVRICDGIIRHFSHGHHHLRLDENTCRDYDENTLCQACVTPIYFGNFYSCMQCEFVLHETCANLSRKIYYPIHAHVLTLSLRGDVMKDICCCAACYGYVAAGFFYECSKEECNFKLHVQCATIYEPLVHESHKQHPLFLTSKPGERRNCCVCKAYNCSKETFNCIECDGFALCFRCATIPQKVRYKHDKHILTLSYGHEDTSTLRYWCEACETKINSKERFYMCDEYCCVTLHMKCLIGTDVYMKPGSSFFSFEGKHVSVLPNNHHMCRPICDRCKGRCSQKIVFRCSGSKFCSRLCLSYFFP